VKFAYSRGIAGVMFWTLDQDDFLGHYCNNGEYPLLTAIYNAINELAPTQSQFVDDVSTSTTHSTTPIDFRLHHHTNKNGINFYKMVDNGSGILGFSHVLLLFCLKLFLLSWLNK
jgi:GH18 family chitinase